jgi:hypothetical protein
MPGGGATARKRVQAYRLGGTNLGPVARLLARAAPSDEWEQYPGECSDLAAGSE